MKKAARTAVPIWVDFMREACVACRRTGAAMPDGIIEMKVNAVTGGKKDADLDPMFEYFRADMLPTDEGYVRRQRRGPGSSRSTSTHPTRRSAAAIRSSER